LVTVVTILYRENVRPSLDLEILFVYLMVLDMRFPFLKTFTFDNLLQIHISKIVFMGVIEPNGIVLGLDEGTGGY